MRAFFDLVPLILVLNDVSSYPLSKVFSCSDPSGAEPPDFLGVPAAGHLKLRVQSIGKHVRQRE